MTYSEFCQAFYIDSKESCLKNLSAQKEIAKFFLEHCLDTDSLEMLIGRGDSTYTKWYTGKTTPAEFWRPAAKSFDFKSYADIIFKSLDDRNIKKLVERFRVQLRHKKGIEKRKLAEAITAQFQAIIERHGKAEDIVASEYLNATLHVDYIDYIRSTMNENSMVKLPGGEEVPAELCYICNRLSSKPTVFPNKVLGSSVIIEDVTPDKIVEFGKKSKQKYEDVFLLACEGMGKSLMLRHLFDCAADDYPDTEIMPVLIDLREFAYNKGDLINSIVGAVQPKDATFTLGKATELLKAGKLYLLFDGLDEIDQTDVADFQRKLNNMRSTYPKTRFVITSRDCDAVKWIHRMGKLYLVPLDNTQSNQLIDALLDYFDAADAKKKIMEFMESEFISTDGMLASNPMLLSYIVLSHESLNSFKKNPLNLYNSLYNLLVSGHDIEKQSFKRMFCSVNNSEEFTEVFKEFCAISYRDAIHEFNQDSFDRVYKSLESTKTFPAHGKMNRPNFQRDACSTACIMYEQEQNIFYIDPWFQHYFFIEYYAGESGNKMKDLGVKLLEHHSNEYGNVLPLAMLFAETPTKVEKCIIRPFLDGIFRGKDNDSNEAFLLFLLNGYEKITINAIVKERAKTALKGADTSYEPKYNAPCTDILSLIYMETGTEPFPIEMDIDMGDYDEFITKPIVGHYSEMATGSDMTKSWYELKPMDWPLYKSLCKEPGNSYFQLLRESNGMVVQLGYQYKIDAYDMVQNPERFNTVIQYLKEKSPIYEDFKKVKKYYSELCKKQWREGLSI